MMHTMAAVARDLSQLHNATVSEVGTMAARSAIMGARGNFWRYPVAAAARAG